MASLASGAARLYAPASRATVLRPRALACGRPLLGSGLRVQLKRLDRVQMEFVSSKGRASSVRGRTVVVQAKKQQFRAPRFGEQPWQYALSMAEDALERFPQAQALVRFVREQPLLSVGIGVALASAISITIASVILPSIFFAIGAVTLLPLFAFIFSAVAFSFGIAAIAIVGGVGGTLLLTSGTKVALLSTAVIPAATALAAGAVAVGVATRIGSAMSQRQQQDGDGADEPSSSGAASAAPGRDGRRQGGGGGGRAGKAEKAGAAPAAEEEEIDLALEELRAFDERLLGPDASEWSPGEVAVWLQKSGFGAYADAFRAQDVDGRVLLSLAFDDLKEQALGISSLGDRKRLSLAVEELKKEQDRKRAGGRGGR